jgi:class 3 adenylate cyclase
MLSPDDLTLEEVGQLLDPDATGVPELAPDRTKHRDIARLEELISQTGGEQQLVLKSRLAYALAPVDLSRARTLQAEMRVAARESGSLRAELEAECVLYGVLPALRGENEDELNLAETRAREIAAHLDLPLQQARVLLSRSASRYLFEGRARDALRLIWQARQLAITADADAPFRADVFGRINQELAILALYSERNFELARRYCAIAVVYTRLVPAPEAVAQIHLFLNFLCSEQGKLEPRRRHNQRAVTIAQHHGHLLEAAQAIYWLGRTQLDMGEIEGARRSVERMRSTASQSETAKTYVVSAMKVLSGLVASAAEDSVGAIETLSEVTDSDINMDETRIAVLRALSRAYEQQDDKDAAIDMLKRTLQVQQQMHDNRSAAVASRFVLGDEIRKLREEHRELSVTAERNASLLQAILPPTAYRQLERNGHCDAQLYPDVAIFFSDFADFTTIASGMPPQQLVQILGQLYDAFDEIMDAHGCERVETIGDAYLAIAGLDDTPGKTTRTASVAVRMTEAALDLAQHLKKRNAEFDALGSPRFNARIGIHRGAVVGGIVGSRRLRFAVFGDAVNTAQRLESGGRPGYVTVSEEVAKALRGHKSISVQPRQSLAAKGKGVLSAYEVQRDE